MPDERHQGVKLRHLSVKNFKALDAIEIDFPPPLTTLDPDVLVMGSKNGVGKTSVLEACALLSLAISTRDVEPLPRSLTEMLVRSGQDSASVAGTFATSRGEYVLRVTIDRAAGRFAAVGDISPFRNNAEYQRDSAQTDAQEGLMSILGAQSDPYIAPPFMYFHSYRKVREGNPGLGSMLGPASHDAGYRRPGRRDEGPASAFKLELLRSMMSQAKLFENLEELDAKFTIETANLLMKRYAGGTTTALRPSPNNTVEFWIEPTGGGPSFAFDGLSSGQKEIISTLFLIWRYTRQAPGIILIDEPELHLNAEWHRSFVDSLQKLAPKNQYIIATHSEDVFASVEERSRLLLSPEAATLHS